MQVLRSYPDITVGCVTDMMSYGKIKHPILCAKCLHDASFISFDSSDEWLSIAVYALLAHLKPQQTSHNLSLSDSVAVGE